MYTPPVDEDLCYSVSVEYAKATSSRMVWCINFQEAIEEAINTLAANKISDIKCITVEVEEYNTFQGMY